MTPKSTYAELERRIAQLETEVREYVRKEKEFNENRKRLEFNHLKRTISLMRINEELNRELDDRKRAYGKDLKQISQRLKERIKELNCLYDISSFRVGADFSLDEILQTIIDFIPTGCLYPERTGARILLDGYEFATKNFQDTGWKFSREITVYTERVGVLEVCFLEEKRKLDKDPFLAEEKDLVNAIAESVARIIEREWAETEIRKHRGRIETLLKPGKRSTVKKNGRPD